jgi:hypothetical protein
MRPLSFGLEEHIGNRLGLAMAEYSRTDASRARHIVEGLLTEDRSREIEVPERTSIADLQTDAAQFQREMELAEALRTDVPVLELDGGPPAPFSLGGLDANRFNAGPHGSLVGFYLNWQIDTRRYVRSLIDALRERVAGVSFVSIANAREFFRDRATEFLAHRIWFGRSAGPGVGPNVRLPPSAGAPTSTLPGCQFVVSTNNHGLTVYWSGAYFIAPNFFGHPTSPAVSVLQAGTYVFGVAGGAYSAGVHWDHNAVCTLPGQPVVHLNY